MSIVVGSHAHAKENDGAVSTFRTDAGRRAKGYILSRNRQVKQTGAPKNGTVLGHVPTVVTTYRTDQYNAGTPPRKLLLHRSGTHARGRFSTLLLLYHHDQRFSTRGQTTRLTPACPPTTKPRRRETSQPHRPAGDDNCSARRYNNRWEERIDRLLPGP